MNKIIFHADDFGLNETSAKRIEDCYFHGNLGSVSIMVNGEYKEVYSIMNHTDIDVRLHLNLVEGPALSEPEKIPLLVDKRGYFKYSFVGLFFLLRTPKRKEAKKQIQYEIEKQMQLFCKITGKKKIGIDSHQHVHMIPAIFAAMLDAEKNLQIPIEEIRIPVEPIRPYVKQVSLYPTYSISNMIKVALLNGLYLRVKPMARKDGIKYNLFMGVMFSGCMDEKRIRRVFPDFVKIAEKRKVSLELLFHPGYLEKHERKIDDKKEKFLHFYFSEGRKIEEKVLKSREFYEFTKSF